MSVKCLYIAGVYGKIETFYGHCWRPLDARRSGSAENRFLGKIRALENAAKKMVLFPILGFICRFQSGFRAVLRAWERPEVRKIDFQEKTRLGKPCIKKGDFPHFGVHLQVLEPFQSGVKGSGTSGSPENRILGKYAPWKMVHRKE